MAGGMTGSGELCEGGSENTELHIDPKLQNAYDAVNGERAAEIDGFYDNEHPEYREDTKKALNLLIEGMSGSTNDFHNDDVARIGKEAGIDLDKPE